MEAKQVQSALKIETEIQENGRLEINVPLEVGAKVVVFVVEKSVEDFADLVNAAESSLDFWDNPFDDTNSNITGVQHHGYYRSPRSPKNI